MINPEAKLSENVFSDNIQKLSMRDGLGIGTVEVGKEDSRVVVLCADLAESTGVMLFKKEFPDRFIEVGVAEQNMATIAAGVASTGKIPFIVSYGVFNPGRNYEQIRTTIALNKIPVKICGTHAGVSVGPDGATHQMLEDIGMMRMLPGMIIVSPADIEEARKAIIAVTKIDSPAYIRFCRANTPFFTTSETPFEIGKALTLWNSGPSDDVSKIAILSTGSLSYQSLLAARALSEDGINSTVLHFSTVKPLDTEAILNVAKHAGYIITVEEHQVAGGFGSFVSEFLSENYPVPVKKIGIKDQFGQSGYPEELLSYYGLDAVNIEKVARDLIDI